MLITLDEKGNWIGNRNQTCGRYESYQFRKEISEKGQENFFKDVQKEFGDNVKIVSSVIDSLTNYEEPIAIRFNLGRMREQYSGRYPARDQEELAKFFADIHKSDRSRMVFVKKE